MSAQVLLYLLNKLGKTEILRLAIIQEHECYMLFIT